MLICKLQIARVRENMRGECWREDRCWEHCTLDVNRGHWALQTLTPTTCIFGVLRPPLRRLPELNSVGTMTDSCTKDEARTSRSGP